MNARGDQQRPAQKLGDAAAQPTHVVLVAGAADGVVQRGLTLCLLDSHADSSSSSGRPPDGPGFTGRAGRALAYRLGDHDY